MVDEFEQAREQKELKMAEEKKVVWENLTLRKFGLICLVIFSLTILLTAKISGSSNLPNEVEKKGYCKIVYGDNWNYNKNGYCSPQEDYTKKEFFTDESFRNVCPKVQLLDLKFYSDCFKKGDLF